MTESDSIDVARLLEERNRLRGIARALLGDEHAAEDAVSEATLRALQRPPRDAAALRAWLASIVRRSSLSKLREERRRSTRERAAATPESAPSADDAVARVEIQRLVIDRVLALREPYRSAIVLRYFEGLSPPAIAARLRVPEKTVTSWLHRGLGILRVELDRQCRGGRRTWCAALLPVAGLDAKVAAAGIGLHTLTVTGGFWIMSRVPMLIAVGLLLVSAIAVGVSWMVEPRAGEHHSSASGPALPSPSRPDVPEAEATVAARDAAPESPTSVEPIVQIDPSDPNGALAIRVRFPDGAEAEPVGLVVRRLDGAPDGARMLETDARGHAILEALKPGAVQVSALRGGEVEGEVSAGRVTQVDLDLPRGVDVHGEVVDAADAPVPNASVWLHKDDTWVGARVETVADGAGRFVLRSVDPARRIAAFADGYLPSGRYPILWGKRAGDVVSIRIPLREKAATLRGRVIDEWKRPVVGARVAVWGGQAEQRESTRYARPNLLLSTDVEGRFETSSASTPDTAFAVSAPGFAPYENSSEVDETLGAEVTIQLDQGVALEGTAYRENGLPAPDVTIEVEAGHLLMFQSVSTRTGPDGHYAIDRLPRLGLRGVARDGDIVVRADLTGPSRDNLRWDPVLMVGGAVRGRVVDPEGAGIAGLVVFALKHPHMPEVGQATTTADGSFSVSGLEVPACCLRVEDPESRAILAVSSWLKVGGPPCRLTVDDATRPSAFLVGSFEDDAGEADRSFVSVSARLDPGNSADVDGLEAGSVARVDDGAFRIGPIRPGRWNVHARAIPGGKWLALAGPIDVAAGETVDVGVLRTVPSGTVTARIAGSTSLDRRSMYVSLTESVLRWGCPIEEEDDVFVARGVVPGEYELRVSARGYLDARVPVLVQSGEDTVVDVQLEPGAEVRIDLTSPTDAPWWKVTELCIRDSAGAPRLEWSSPFYPNQEVITVSAKLPVGTFTVEAWTDSGLRANGEVEVRDLGQSMNARFTLE